MKKQRQSEVKASLNGLKINADAASQIARQLGNCEVSEIHIIQQIPSFDINGEVPVEGRSYHHRKVGILGNSRTPAVAAAFVGICGIEEKPVLEIILQ